MEADGTYLDTDGIATLLGVSPETVKPLLKTWRQTGGKAGIPHALIGSKLIRSTREDVRKFYENQKAKTATGVDLDRRML